MNTKINPTETGNLFDEGMRLNLEQDRSPANATLARAFFQQAAENGHRGAVRALAHMIYEGRGGIQDKAQGLFLLWNAFKYGDVDALEEFCDLFATYAEEGSDSDSIATLKLAVQLEQAKRTLERVEWFFHEISRHRIGQV